MTTQAEIWRKEETDLRQKGFTLTVLKTRTQLKTAGLKEHVHFDTAYSWSGGCHNRKTSKLLLNKSGHKMLSSYCEKIEQKKQFNAAGGRKTTRGYKFNGEIYKTIELALEAVNALAVREKETELWSFKAARREAESLMRARLGSAADSVIEWHKAGCPHPVPLDSVIYVEKTKSGLSWVEFEK